MLEPGQASPTDPTVARHPAEDSRATILVLAVFAFGVAFVFGTSPRIFRDGDVSWHIAAGRWMLDYRAIPYTDPFSYTAFGKPWIAHEWLSEVVMAAAFNAFGYTGIALLTGAALSATFLIIGLRLARWAPPVELCIVLMVVGLLLYPFMLGRPMMLVWPLLALWIEVILRAREHDRLPPLYLIPLTTLWINLHASFALGLGILAMFGLEALIAATDKRRAFVQWLLFGTACGIAALINPNGLAGAMIPLGAFTSSTISLIGEFRPTVVNAFPAFEAALLLFLAVSLWRGARLAPVRLLLALILLHLAFAHARHQALAGIVIVMVAAPALTRRWIAGEPPARPVWPELKRIAGGAGPAAAGLLVLAVLAIALRLAMPVQPRDSAVNPERALAALPPSLRTERVLNEYSIGGPLILRGIPVFMDGRTDVYGDEHFLHYREIWDGNPREFAAAHAKWRFCWTIFPVDQKEIVALLDKSAGWKRIYTDKTATIHVRPPCGIYR